MPKANTAQHATSFFQAHHPVLQEMFTIDCDSMHLFHFFDILIHDNFHPASRKSLKTINYRNVLYTKKIGDHGCNLYQGHCQITLNLVKVEHDEQSLQIFVLILQISELLLVYPENELLIGIHQALSQLRSVFEIWPIFFVDYLHISSIFSVFPFIVFLMWGSSSEGLQSLCNFGHYCI